jgi:hypothetical protein
MLDRISSRMCGKASTRSRRGSRAPERAQAARRSSRCLGCRAAGVGRWKASSRGREPAPGTCTGTARRRAAGSRPGEPERGRPGPRASLHLRWELAERSRPGLHIPQYDSSASLSNRRRCYGAWTRRAAAPPVPTPLPLQSQRTLLSADPLRHQAHQVSAEAQVPEANTRPSLRLPVHPSWSVTAYTDHHNWLVNSLSFTSNESGCHERAENSAYSTRHASLLSPFELMALSQKSATRPENTWDRYAIKICKKEDDAGNGL